MLHAKDYVTHICNYASSQPDNIALLNFYIEKELVYQLYIYI